MVRDLELQEGSVDGDGIGEGMGSVGYDMG
jgi:hypothetical protein